MLIRIVEPGGATREFSKDRELTIGRAEDCSIHLPGMLVAKRHARLVQQADGTLQLASLSPLGFEFRGKTGVAEAELGIGDSVRIGGHTLRVSVDADDPQQTVIQFTLGDTRRGLTYQGTRTDLAAAGWRMRRPALRWLALVLIFLLAVPLGLRFLNLPPALAAYLPTERLWETGTISRSHANLEWRCDACHKSLFVPVQDGACLACHAGLGSHSSHPQVKTGLNLGERGCAGCHHEHGGAHALKATHPALCTDCHAAKFAEFPDLQPVRDFNRSHPEFRPTVVAAGTADAPTRAQLSASLREHSGLLFPHDLHLKAGGVRGPAGMRQLDCASCHTPDAGMVGFRAVSYEHDCASCHALEANVGGQTIALPHAKLQAVRTLVQAQQAGAPAPAEANEEPSRPGFRAQRPGELSADDLISEIISQRVCGRCHEIQNDAQGQPAPRPPALAQSGYRHAKFTHALHRATPCKQCHAAATSASSEELLLPGIATCRSCHVDLHSPGGVETACSDCHHFHQPNVATGIVAAPK
ncbi:MAG TPA: FHA domain-containing protein [Solimonas sp.]|nr:FHA domain-containing protein [Solimonas sp.]